MSSRASSLWNLTTSLQGSYVLANGTIRTSPSLPVNRFRSCVFFVATSTPVGSPKLNVQIELSPDDTNWYSGTLKQLSHAAAGISDTAIQEPVAKFCRLTLSIASGTSVSVVNAFAEART